MIFTRLEGRVGSTETIFSLNSFMQRERNHSIECLLVFLLVMHVTQQLEKNTVVHLCFSVCTRSSWVCLGMSGGMSGFMSASFSCCAVLGLFRQKGRAGVTPCSFGNGASSALQPVTSKEGARRSARHEPCLAVLGCCWWLWPARPAGASHGVLSGLLLPGRAQKELEKL